MAKARKGPKRERPDEGPAEESREAAERKEKVLHARIPESLDREIKKRAQNLGLSVSTVVRHVLLNTFDLVEDIVADSTQLALSITGGRPRPAERHARSRTSSEHTAGAESEVLGWQEVVLNRNAVCDRCNGILLKGTRAAMGIRDTPGPQTILCLDCLDSVAQSTAEDTSANAPERPSADASENAPERPSTGGTKRRARRQPTQSGNRRRGRLSG